MKQFVNFFKLKEIDMNKISKDMFDACINSIEIKKNKNNPLIIE